MCALFLSLFGKGNRRTSSVKAKKKQVKLKGKQAAEGALSAAEERVKQFLSTLIV